MDMIFQLDGVKTITDSYPDDFDGPDSGYTADGPCMSFLTNFPPHRLPLYLTAIQHSGLNASDFGIADQAYGQNSDTGVRWPHDPTMYKAFFHNVDHDDLQKFHRAFDDVLKAHPTFKH